MGVNAELSKNNEATRVNSCSQGGSAASQGVVLVNCVPTSVTLVNRALNRFGAGQLRSHRCGAGQQGSQQVWCWSTDAMLVNRVPNSAGQQNSRQV